MRTLKALVVLVVIFVALFALPTGVALGGDVVEENNAIMEKYLAPGTVNDVIAGEFREGKRELHGHIMRTDVVLREIVEVLDWAGKPTGKKAGKTVVRSGAATRKEPWKDELGRISVELYKLQDKTGGPDRLVAKSLKPKVGKGSKERDDDRWSINTDPISEPVIPLMWDLGSGKLSEFMPEEFIREAAKGKVKVGDKEEVQSLTLRTMPSGKFYFTSASFLTDGVEGAETLLPLEQAVFVGPFSDGNDVSVMVRYGVKGLEAYMDGVKILVGVSEDVNPNLDRSKYATVAVFIGKEGAIDTKAPSRLPDWWRGYPGSNGGRWTFRKEGKYEPRYWFSQRWIYINRLGNRELRFDSAPEFLVSFEPGHSDSYGPFACFQADIMPDSARQIVGHFVPETLTWLWPVERPPSEQALQNSK